MKQAPFRQMPLLLPTLLAAGLVAGGLMITLDAARQRACRRRSEPEIQSIVGLLGTADMALSSASRWLRHPSLSEPGAAFADAPAILDADPAGAMIAPPRALLAGASANSSAFQNRNRSVPDGEHTRPRVHRPAPSPVGSPVPATAPGAGALPGRTESSRPNSRVPP